MRKERYKLIGMLLFTILMLTLGFIAYIQGSDSEIIFMIVMIGTMPYGYCILSKPKEENYDTQYTDFSYIRILVKYSFKIFIGSFIGIFAFIPMLWILISNVKKENEEFSERRVYFMNKIDGGESTISGIKNRFSDRYLPVLEKYPECLKDSKNALSLLIKLNQLQNKLFHIQLYEGNIFYSGLVSTFIVNLKLKKVINQIDKIFKKVANYAGVMSKLDYMEEDEDCLCELADELNYVEHVCQNVEEAEWVIDKHQEMFRFFLKRDLIVLGMVVLFWLCL